MNRPDPRDNSLLKAEFAKRYQPDGLDDDFLVEVLATSETRIDVCFRRGDALRAYHVERATLCWDVDRRADVEEIASRLERDPARTVSRLKRKKHGVEWLIERWTMLETLLNANGKWTDGDDALALDLLAVPAPLRDRKPWEAVGLRSASDLIGRELAHLERLKSEALDRLDTMERQFASEGTPIESPPELKAHEREESAWIRRHFWARGRLDSDRRERAKQDSLTAIASRPPVAEIQESPILDRPPLTPIDEGEFMPRPSETAAKGPSPVVAPSPVPADAPQRTDAPTAPLLAGNRRERRAMARRRGR